MLRVRSVGAAIQRRANAVATGVTAALLLAVLLQTTATAATSVTISLDAAGFSYNYRTTHQIGLGSVCPNPATPTNPTEHNGAIEEGGGYVHDLTMPQGATIRSFRLSAEDNDPDVNVFAYLGRKKLTTQGGNFLSGYKVLASVHTAGTQAGIHRVGTTTISSPKVDDSQYAYFVELVNCASTTNPAGIQVTYTK